MVLGTIEVQPEWLMLGTALVGGALISYFNSKIRALRKSNAQYSEVLKNLQEGVYRTSLEGRQLSANPALVRLNGYTCEEELLNSVKDLSREWYVDPNRRDEFKSILFENGKVSNFISEIYRHNTRERIWISENARLVFDPETLEPLYYEGSVREITDEMLYRESQERLGKLSKNLPGGLFQLKKYSDGTFNALYLSDSFLHLVGDGLDIKSISISEYLERIHKDDVKSYIRALNDSGETLEPVSMKYRYYKSNDQLIWLHLTATPERQGDNETIWHGYVMDITDQVEVQKKVERLAYHDELTGLPKRSVIEDNLLATISSCNRREEHAALMFIDLDNFKALNDTHGHESGDALLKQVAERLQKLMRANDTVGRYGGDEFIIIAGDLGDNRETAKLNAGALASKILKGFHDPFKLGDVEFFTTPSIGIAIVDHKLPSADDLMKAADQAMYRAKKSGCNNYIIHDSQSGDTQIAMSAYQKDLKTAVANNEFELLFQPQIDRNSALCGAEAYIRWNHPKNGVLPPQDFMPIAERNGSMIEINNWVINTAIAQLEKWQANPKTRHLTLAVNINVQQFSSCGFAKTLENQLSKASINRPQLTLELTEAILNRGVEVAKDILIDLKKCGIKLSLDDFGTGKSSLSSLNVLPFDEVKIDGYFVSSIESDGNNRSLIEGILGLANALKLDAVAEHVSSSYQENYLKERGCKKFQGYHYYPPMKLSSFEEVVELHQKPLNLSVAI